MRILPTLSAIYLTVLPLGQTAQAQVTLGCTASNCVAAPEKSEVILEIPTVQPLQGCDEFDTSEFDPIKVQSTIWSTLSSYSRTADIRSRYPHPEKVLIQDCGELIVATPFGDKNQFGRTTRLITVKDHLVMRFETGDPLISFTVYNY